MSAGQLRVESITGVDVELEIAGVGSRSYAFLIDFHIRLVLAVAWYIIAGLIGAGTAIFTLAPSIAFKPFVLLPAAALYLLYHPVLEVAMHGRTPGKRMAGIRIASVSGDTPGVGALLVRNVFRLLDTLPMFYIVGLVTACLTRQQVRVGDLAAGTVLVRDRSDRGALERIGGAIEQGTMSPRLAELADELLQRWSDLDSGRRIVLARRVLQQIDGSVSLKPPSELDEGALKVCLERLLGRISPQ